MTVHSKLQYVALVPPLTGQPPSVLEVEIMKQAEDRDNPEHGVRHRVRFPIGSDALATLADVNGNLVNDHKCGPISDEDSQRVARFCAAVLADQVAVTQASDILDAALELKRAQIAEADQTIRLQAEAIETQRRALADLELAIAAKS